MVLILAEVGEGKLGRPHHGHLRVGNNTPIAEKGDDLHAFHLHIPIIDKTTTSPKVPCHNPLFPTYVHLSSVNLLPILVTFEGSSTLAHQATQKHRGTQSIHGSVEIHEWNR